MKLIVQSDDFGITESVSCGIVKGIREGVITCTGLFSNMDDAEESVRMLEPYDVCLGEDINIVAGDPVSDPSLIPCMVDENGHFLKSGAHRKIDAQTPGGDHLVYEQCLIEVEAQIQRFIELTGKAPAYLHGHSYGTPTLGRAMHEMSEKYHARITFDMYEKHHVQMWKKSWYGETGHFTAEDQLNTNPLDVILNDAYAPLDAEIALLGTHCGFVEQELFNRSSFTIIRMKDLAAITDPRFKEWMKAHDCELISFNDLKD